MANLGDFPKKYTDMVRAAVATDRSAEQAYVKKAFAAEPIAPSLMKATALVRALKAIAAEVDVLEYAGRKMTEDEQNEMYREVGRKLGLPMPDDFSVIAKGASNDAYMQMITHISILLGPSGGKK